MKWGTENYDMTTTGNVVQVWNISLRKHSGCFEELRPVLSSDEIRRSEYFYRQKDRDRFVIAHGLLKLLLSYYLGVSPAKLDITHNRFGKPSLRCSSPYGKLCFNMSHSNSIVTYAFCWNREVGVDIEQVRPIQGFEAVVERFWPEQKRLFFLKLPDSRKALYFFTWWTRVEAYLKAKGKGLTRFRKDLDTSSSRSELEKLFDLSREVHEVDSWTVRKVAVGDARYVASVVAEGHGWRLACMKAK